MLIQKFNEHKITGGISGWLRQEFRDLNALDDITRLRYEGHLPDNIFGPLQNPAPRAYYVWIGDLKDDGDWHSTVKYKVGECKVKPVESDATWDINMFHALRRVGANCVSLKRGTNKIDAMEKTGRAVKFAQPASISHLSPPLGLIWDSENYSCAYDSLFTILYNIWIDAPAVWSNQFSNITDYLSMLSDAFHLVRDKVIRIEDARDRVRQILNHLNPGDYPMGSDVQARALSPRPARAGPTKPGPARALITA